MKINDVFFKNSNLLSSTDDCSGLWLFATFKENSFIEAIILKDKIESWGNPDWLLQSWAPDMSFPLINAKGVVREKNCGNRKETTIEGKGILEFAVAYKNPFK